MSESPATSPQVWKIGYSEGLERELAAVSAVVASHGEQIAAAWPSTAQRIVLLGIGASYAALATPMIQLRTAGFDVYRSDGSDLPAVPTSGPDLVIAVSQSGRSREICAAVQDFADRRTPTIAIVNSDTSPLGAIADTAITLGGQPDSRVSTVGFMITYVALAMLSDVAAAGAVSPGWAGLTDVITETVGAAGRTVGAFAQDHLGTGSVDLVAATAQLSAAEATALLFREGPLVPSASYPTRSYLHGPMDSVGPVGSASSAQVVMGDEREQQLITQLAERTDAVLAITPTVPTSGAHVAIPDDLPATQRALVELAVLQHLVAATAEARDVSIDTSVFRRLDTKI